MVDITKAAIKLKDGSKLKCLFNPSDLKITRTVEHSEKKVFGRKPKIQYTHANSAILTFKLFFDTYSSGIETGNSDLEDNNSKAIMQKADVSKFTEPFLKLIEINEDTHQPDEVTFEWGKFTFTGYITQIVQDYTMFSPNGVPLRATLDITMKSSKEKKVVTNSPDRTKHRVVKSGERLYSFAYAEYGDCAEWRRIAEANGIDNPRRLKSGESIVIPAII